MKLERIAVAAVLISAALSLTTDASAQVTPEVTPSPPHANPATYVASNSFTARWNRVSGATGYRLDVSANSSFNNYVGVYHNLNVGNSRSVTGLNASTMYYYRVRAYNGSGASANSNIVNVRTLTAMGAPVVITNPASLVASFSATLNGSVDPHGFPTTVRFEYGTTTNYGQTTANLNRNGNTFQNVAANIPNLTANTTYHFRIVATNSAGGPVRGGDRTCRTLSETGPPVVITNPATLVASFSATLNGLVDPHGLPTTVRFEWGTTNTYGQTTSPQNRNGNTYQSVSPNIPGLNANTAYHFRIVATNSAGTTRGLDRIFTTLAPTGPPVVITNPATGVGSFSAVLNGSVDPHGFATTVHFQYGTTTNYGSVTADENYNGNTYQNGSANVAGLIASTTYHFRIAATNTAGPSYGSDQLFNTLAAATATPTPTPSAPATATPTVTPTPTPFGATPTPVPPCTWIKRAAVPYPARGIFAASDGTYVYCGGGYDGNTIHADLLRYEPAANLWTSLASSPDQHCLSQAVFSGNRIYNMGGFGPSGVTNTTRIYDVATNSWTTGAPMPVALGHQATVLWNGIIYVAGGYNSNGVAVNTLYAYNIASNTWSTLAPMPQALYLPGFGAINGRLYIAAGNNGASELNTLYIYDIASNTWRSGPDVPTAVTGPGSTVYCYAQLWVYGGGFPTTRNIMQIYDPDRDKWFTGPSTPNPNVNRLWFYGTAIDNTSIVAPGGDTVPGTPINANEQLVKCSCKTKANATRPQQRLSQPPASPLRLP